MLDIVLRCLGGVVVTWAAVLLTLLEAVLVPLRLFGVRIPIVLPVVVVFNVGLILAARLVTGSKLAALLPGLAWCAVVMLLASPTTEGDLILNQDWVVLAFLAVGAGSVAVAAYLVAVPPQRFAGRAG